MNFSENSRYKYFVSRYRPRIYILQHGPQGPITTRHLLSFIVRRGRRHLQPSSTYGKGDHAALSWIEFEKPRVLPSAKAIQVGLKGAGVL